MSHPESSGMCCMRQALWWCDQACWYCGDKEGSHWHQISCRRLLHLSHESHPLQKASHFSRRPPSWITTTWHPPNAGMQPATPLPDLFFSACSFNYHVLSSAVFSHVMYSILLYAFFGSKYVYVAIIFWEISPQQGFLSPLAIDFWLICTQKKYSSVGAGFVNASERFTLICAFRWTHTNFSTFHTIQILTVIVKKLM
jgi:hypothetical protein